MDNLLTWYRRIPRQTTSVSRFLLAILITVIAIYAYDLTIKPDHPYLVGLFPVIASALIAGAWPGIASLIVTSAYLYLVYGPHPNSVVAITLFSLEGLIVIWLISQQREAKQRLARVVTQRETELAQLRQIHDHLVLDTATKSKSSADLKESNRILLQTLENILDKHRNN